MRFRIFFLIAFVGLAIFFIGGFHFTTTFPGDRTLKERHFDDAVMIRSALCGCIGLAFSYPLLFDRKPSKISVKIVKVILFATLTIMVGTGLFMGLAADMLNRSI